MVDLSVVVPLYNGKDHINPLLGRLVPILEALNQTWEVYFVDDRSTDGGFDFIRAVHDGDRRITGCRLKENRGQQNALYAGLVNSRGRYVITMDDDGQHPAERIPQLLSRLKGESLDCLYLVNRDRPRSLFLKLGTGLTGLFFTLFCGKPRGVDVGSFRILTRELIDRIKGAEGPFVYISALILMQKPRVASFRYGISEVDDAREGSRFRPASLLRLYGRLVLYYGPLSRLVKREGSPYELEEEL